MSQRSDISTTALSGCRALRGVQRSVPEPVESRASSLEECTYRTDVHSRGAAAAGETPQRRFAVAARRDAPIAGQRERAALALTDELTRPTGEGVPDPVGKEVSAAWSEQETADPGPAGATINAWNRIALATRLQPAAP